MFSSRRPSPFGMSPVTVLQVGLQPLQMLGSIQVALVLFLKATSEPDQDALER